MSKISEITYKTLEKHFRQIVEDVCQKYIDNPEKFHMKQIEENGELTGYAVYHEENGVRYVDEVHYVGSDKMKGYSLLKFIITGAKTIVWTVLKTNQKMIGFYIRIGAKIIKEEGNNIYFEFERGVI